jgi:hypothetical protein
VEGGHLLEELDREAMPLRRYGSVQDIPETDNDLWVDYQNAVLKQGTDKGLQIKKLYAR